MAATGEFRADARAPLAWPALLAGVVALVYALSYRADSDALILGNDVITYALALATGERELAGSANHLGYHWLCRGAYELLAGLGGERGAWLALRAQQVVSVAAGALLVFVVARFALRRVGVGLCVPLALALASASGPWIYAAIGDSVVPGLALGAGAWCAALDDARQPARRPWALCAWLAAAAIVRQDAVLSVPAFALLLPARRWVWAFGAAGAAALAVYALAWLASPTELSFARWLLGSGADGSWNAGLGVFASCGRALWSALLACVGAAEHAPLRALPFALALLGLLACAGAPPALARRALLACALGAGLRLLFFGWFQAINVEYQIATLAPCVLGCIVWLEPRAAVAAGPRWRGALGCAWALAASLVVVTWAQEIAPRRGAGLAERARVAIQAAGPGGLVLSLDPPTSLAVLRELHGRSATAAGGVELFAAEGAGSASMPERALRLLKRADAALADGRGVVIAFDAAIEDSYRLAVGAMRADPARVEALARRYDARALAWVGATPVVWQLSAPR